MLERLIVSIKKCKYEAGNNINIKTITSIVCEKDTFVQKSKGRDILDLVD